MEPIYSNFELIMQLIDFYTFSPIFTTFKVIYVYLSPINFV